MKHSVQIVAGILLVGVGFAAGAVWGTRHGQFQAALEENKVAASCLKAADLELSAEFREYLKGRIYYYIASKFPNDQSYLSRTWDFGPVDLNVLKRRIYAKDPTFDSESFDGAIIGLSSADPIALQDSPLAPGSGNGR
ncbi:MAG: hypothetical protein J0M24_20220 [Verrucomicrobia bacterium]|nr:hypothetical protein [Verrucomicrobiota bacterium]